MKKDWRNKLIKFMNSPQIKRTDFTLKEVYDDEGTNINTVDFYDVIETLLFFWRFNICERNFKLQGDKEYNDFEIVQFQKKANQFLKNTAVGEAENIKEYYAQNYSDDKMIEYVKENVEFNEVIRLKID